MTEQPKDAVDELFGVLILRRRNLKLTKQQVAATIGISREKLAAMENGTLDPPLRFLLDYAHAVGMELEWTLRAPRPAS